VPFPRRWILLPAARSAREPHRQRRLRVRRRFRLCCRSVDLPLEFFVIRQPCELVHEHQGVMRWNLEFLSAGLARHVVIKAEHVVAQLRELGKVGVVSPRRRPALLRASHPPNAVFTGPSAPRALVSGLASFRLLREEDAFVHHAPMLAMNGAGGAFLRVLTAEIGHPGPIFRHRARGRGGGDRGLTCSRRWRTHDAAGVATGGPAGRQAGIRTTFARHLVLRPRNLRRVRTPLPPRPRSRVPDPGCLRARLRAGDPPHGERAPKRSGRRTP